MLAWLSLLVLRMQLPLKYGVSFWSPVSGPQLRLSWLLDFGSWSLTFALLTILLAWQFSYLGKLRKGQTESLIWGITLTLPGLLAVLSGNGLALVLAWSGLDILLLVARLRQLKDRVDANRILAFFSSGLAGTAFLLWALISQGTSSGVDFAAIPVTAAFALLLGAGIRLGAMPLNPYLLTPPDSPLPRAALWRLMLASATLAPIWRLNNPLAQFKILLMLLALFTALYASIQWLRTVDRYAGLPFWVLGFSTMALAAAINGQTTAAFAWTLVVALPGGLLFLVPVQNVPRGLLGGLGILLLAGLPFTPSYAGSGFYAQPGTFLNYAFFLPHSLLILGWLRKAEQKGWEEGEARVSLAGFPVLGAALLSLSHLVLGLGLAPALSFSALGFWLWPPIVLLLFLGASILLRRARPLTEKWANLLERAFSLTWLYRLVGQFVRQGAALLSIFSGLLEGRAGVLWALLTVALLLSVITQLNMPG